MQSFSWEQINWSNKVALTFLLLLSIGITPVSAWWSDDWDFRKRINIDTSLQGIPLEASVYEPVVLLRLHLGNFVYFTDVNAQGSDLRFIASDDETPLPYIIEKIDTVAGIANIWVKLPELGGQDETHIYMYYGNAESRSAESLQQFWDASTVVVYHFNETAGLPRDATAFGHHPIASNVTPGIPGIIGAGIGLDGSNKLSIGASETINLVDSGFTISAWIKPAAKQPAASLLSTGELRIDIDNGFVNAQLGEANVRSKFPLNNGQWQHIAFSSDTRRLALYVDGKLVAESAEQALPIAIKSDVIHIGAILEENGFVGSMDELRISTMEIDAEAIKFQALSQREESKLIKYDEDESRSSSGSDYFGLLWVMLDSVRIEGWVIIGLIILLGFLSFDIIIAKAIQLGRAEKYDKIFIEQFDLPGKQTSVAGQQDDGPLAKLYTVYQKELAEISNEYDSSFANQAAIEVLRSALDSKMIQITDELNRKIALITMAISGGPFLGLLGTVLGVMITFATIASVGDVNVRTIAPGVAAALTTTVLGLAVAIPSLFGYNYVAGRVTRRVTAMEVFSDRLISQAAVQFAKNAITIDRKNAA